MEVGIVGLGLIGGSLALDLRALGYRVWGISRRVSTCRQALERGAIDAYFDWGVNLPQNTDLVVICTPIEQIIPSLAALVDYLPSTTIVTDVGSVKTPIVARGEKLWPNFIGSHPMAGNNNTGISSAVPGLFRGRPCAVVGKGDGISERVRDLWRSVGMEVYFCDAQDHDRAVAWISHLPVMISAALNLACGEESMAEVRALGQKLASSGFADTSRVGGGNPELGRMMAQMNRSALLHTLDHYQAVLTKIRQQIEREDWNNLEITLSLAQKLRGNYCPTPSS